MAQQANYTIPSKFRRMENMHIIFWLLKDVSWCMGFRILGVVMVIPTLAISIWILLKNKQYVSEICHNLAIVFWISANSFWMTSEFFSFDETPILFGLSGKHCAMIPFILGMLCLVYYYAIWRPTHKKVDEIA
jgi:hypothetical protein